MTEVRTSVVDRSIPLAMAAEKALVAFYTWEDSLRTRTTTTEVFDALVDAMSELTGALPMVPK